jgi:hypothetical protein
LPLPITIKTVLPSIKQVRGTAKTFHTDKEDNRGEQEDMEPDEKVKFYFRGLTPLFFFLY